MRTTGALAPLGERDFRLYFASRIVNLLGALMAPVALAFAVLQISDSPTALGVVLAAHSIPMVIFLLAGGVLADRFGRTLVIQTANVVAGLSQGAIAALVITGQAEIWHVVVLTAVNGVAAAAALPALAGVLPQLVPRSQLQPANVLVSMAGGGLAVAGPTVSSLLVVGVGPGWALAVDAATYLGAAALLSRIALPRPVRAAGSCGDHRPARGVDVLPHHPVAVDGGPGVQHDLRGPPGRRSSPSARPWPRTPRSASAAGA